MAITVKELYRMASTSIRSTIVSSSSLKQQTFDVFLSFRGEDTRKNFTENLYTALKQQGIEAFRDDEELEKGKAISDNLLKAIEESRYSIIVMSENYASSKWCLKELAKIIECKNTNGQTVLPVFYYVDPLDVRMQTGCFEKSFSEHEEKLKDNIEEVQIWKNAMTIVGGGDLRGWNTKDRQEREIIKEIVHVIFSELQPDLLSYGEKLIGIRPRIHQVNSLLGVGSDDKRFLGICGIEGIGKTTIARVIYRSILHEFDGSCFLANVKEASKGSFALLQIQLLSRIVQKGNIEVQDDAEGAAMIRRELCNSKVLLVLDGIDQRIQLEKLGGGHDWFGFGSRVIITTRDEELLVAHGVDKTYTVEGLNQDEALRLFCQKAFGEDSPKQDYVDLSNQVVQHSGGVPSTLKALGSFLHGRRIEAWEDALEKLKEDSNYKETCGTENKIQWTRGNEEAKFSRSCIIL